MDPCEFKPSNIDITTKPASITYSFFDPTVKQEYLIEYEAYACLDTCGDIIWTVTDLDDNNISFATFNGTYLNVEGATLLDEEINSIKLSAAYSNCTEISESVSI